MVCEMLCFLEWALSLPLGPREPFSQLHVIGLLYYNLLQHQDHYLACGKYFFSVHFQVQLLKVTRIVKK